MRRIFFFIGVCALVWAGGFAAFYAAVLEPAAHPAQQKLATEQSGLANEARGQIADGIVVFTGEGARVARALDLFGKGIGERLLISGVHPDTSLSELEHLYGGAADRFACCVDLGRTAHSTRGNARETNQWVDENGFATVLLITSDYHMPRALAEARVRLPETDVIAYAVASGLITARGLPASLPAGLALIGEYNKYLIALVGRLF